MGATSAKDVQKIDMLSNKMTCTRNIAEAALQRTNGEPAAAKQYVQDLIDFSERMKCTGDVALAMVQGSNSEAEAVHNLGLLRQFSAKMHCSDSEAVEVLQGTNWDLNAAEQVIKRAWSGQGLGGHANNEGNNQQVYFTPPGEPFATVEFGNPDKPPTRADLERVFFSHDRYPHYGGLGST